jgi:hypothetical protein
MPFYVYTLIPLLSHFNKFFFSETADCIQTFSCALHHIPEMKTILNRFYLYYPITVIMRRRTGDDSHFVISFELWDYGAIPQRDVINPFSSPKEPSYDSETMSISWPGSPGCAFYVPLNDFHQLFFSKAIDGG